jgi:hypothetical protein
MRAGAAVVDLFGEVREQHAAKQADYESTRRPIRDYAELIPEPGFGALDFQRFPHLLEPFYSDAVAAAHEVVFKKSTQIGASTGLWRWAVRESDQFGRTTIYTFPTQSHVNDFGDERIEPAIEGSEYLLSRIPAGFVHTKGLKRIGRGWLYLRGAKSRSGAQSTSAQSIVFDEYDELEAANVAQFERRLSGARQTGKVPRLRRAGIPRFPGGPMETAYAASDRREWMVTCPACQLEQPLRWADNVRWTMPPERDGTMREEWCEEDGTPRVYRAGHDVERLDMDEQKMVGRAWRACSGCEAELEGAPILGGRWVAQNPGHPVIGFYIHRLIVQDADVAEMVANSRKTAPSDVEAFHSNDLGEAYAAAEAALTEEDVLRAASFGGPVHVPVYRGTLETIAGVDVASERNMNVSIHEVLPDGRRKAVRITEARSFQEVHALLVAYNVMVTVIDSQPERRLARALAAELPGRVHLAVFVEPGFDPRSQPEALDFDPKRNLVKLHRTESIDAMMDGVRRAWFMPTAELPAGYIEQMTAPVRRTEYDVQGRGRRVYVTPSGRANDYAFAETYALAAYEMWKLRKRLEMEQAMATTPVPDEMLGIRRGGLDALGEGELRDSYNPGFGGRTY